MRSCKGFFGAFLFLVFVFYFSFALDYNYKISALQEKFASEIISSSLLVTKKTITEHFASNLITSVISASFSFGFDSSAIKSKINESLISYFEEYGFSKIGLCAYKFSFSSNKLRKEIQFFVDSKDDFSLPSKVLVLKQFGFVFVEFFVPLNSKFFPCAVLESNNKSTFFVLSPGFSKSALVILQ